MGGTTYIGLGTGVSEFGTAALRVQLGHKESSSRRKEAWLADMADPPGSGRKRKGRR